MNVPAGFTDKQREHVWELRDTFESTFGLAEGDELVFVRAPGRTEIAGNHTDHEGGVVIGAAVDRYITGVFSPNGQQVIRILSEGYPEFDVELGELEPREAEFNTSRALVRGLAALFAERGFATAGFDAYITSDVPGGSGLSSSAAFELEIASAMNVLWAKGLVAPEDLAIMSQAAENRWFGKPCGLLDQASSALGSIQYMSFAVPGTLEAEEIGFDFAEAGYAIVLVEVGADHAALTSEYAAIPGEQQAVAALFGKSRLGEVDEGLVFERYGEIREKLGDRAAVRTIHFYRENRLTVQRAEALKAGDVERFIELTRLSGASSAMYLQNVSVRGAEGQPAMAALALAEELAGERGAVRIHGGGFGGTIQAFVPLEKAEDFALSMDAALGCFATAGDGVPADGPAQIYNIDHEGARAWRL